MILTVTPLQARPKKGGDKPPETARSADVEAPVPLLTAPAPDVPGPKRVVAVGRFDTIGSFTQSFGDWDIGGGMSAMLVSALVESERFTVVERAYLSQLLGEQELSSQSLNQAGTGPELGSLAGVQYLLFGAITEFGGSDRGGGFSIGIGGLPGGLRGGLGPQFSKGKVTMEVRIVDTTTGEIVQTFRVSEKLTQTSWNINLSRDQVSLGNNNFKKTPLGEACRRALTRVVHELALKSADEPWIGRIVESDGTTVYINAGSEAGVKLGDVFRVYRYGKVFTDPATGKVLSRREDELGSLEVVSIEPAMASCYFSGSASPPQRGDLVGSPKPAAITASQRKN